SSRRRHTRSDRDWSSDVCSSDLHEVVYDNDPDLHFARGGAIEALEQAKREGKVRFVGFTGHKDPAIHLKTLAHNYPFDTCQMPQIGRASCRERVYISV